jgi:hypothetical protein
VGTVGVALCFNVAANRLRATLKDSTMSEEKQKKFYRRDELADRAVLRTHCRQG